MTDEEKMYAKESNQPLGFSVSVTLEVKHQGLVILALLRPCNSHCF